MINYSTEKIKENATCSIISDVLDTMGYRNQTISLPVRPLNDDVFIWGPAFTSIGTQVYTMPEDPLTAQCKVVDQLSADEIYVLRIRGEKNCAVFGELFGTAVLNKGGAGVLTDGLIRDVKHLKSMNFPIFHGGYNPKTSKGRCEINECQIPVVIEGVTINPGDYILGDVDGVVIIPKDIVNDVLDETFLLIEKENDVRDGLNNGATLEEVYQKNGAI